MNLLFAFVMSILALATWGVLLETHALFHLAWAVGTSARRYGWSTCGPA